MSSQLHRKVILHTEHLNINPNDTVETGIRHPQRVVYDIHKDIDGVLWGYIKYHGETIVVRKMMRDVFFESVGNYTPATEKNVVMEEPKPEPQQPQPNQCEYTAWPDDAPSAQSTCFFHVYLTTDSKIHPIEGCACATGIVARSYKSKPFPVILRGTSHTNTALLNFKKGDIVHIECWPSISERTGKTVFNVGYVYTR